MRTKEWHLETGQSILLPVLVCVGTSSPKRTHVLSLDAPNVRHWISQSSPAFPLPIPSQSKWDEMRFDSQEYTQATQLDIVFQFTTSHFIFSPLSILSFQDDHEICLRHPLQVSANYAVHAVLNCTMPCCAVQQPPDVQYLDILNVNQRRPSRHAQHFVPGTRHLPPSLSPFSSTSHPVVSNTLLFLLTAQREVHGSWTDS